MPRAGKQVEVVPARAARRLLMHAQGLLEEPSRPATSAAVYKAIERMGFVQLDTITVVERAHNHILATRFDGYRPATLDRLHREARLFEHMTHDASLIPTRWFPHWRHRFEKPARRAWIEGRLGDRTDAVLAEVVERIQTSGPLPVREFESSDGHRAGPWWDWRPHKAALEYLWRTGRLAVAHRVNFHKVYDLTERALPKAHALPTPDDAEHLDWACSTALERLGVATPSELAHFWRAVPIAGARSWSREQARLGQVAEVLVESENGSPARPAFALPDWRCRVARAPEAPDRIRLLSPFDPVVRDRARCLRLFNFDYRFEAFVPAPKRRFGYYVLPILEGERLTGRLDAKLHRNEGELRVLGLWWEPGVRPTRPRRAALAACLDRFAAYLGARSWSLPG